MANGKSRNRYLLDWLLLIILGNLFELFLYGSEVLAGDSPWYSFAFVLISLFDIACVLALFAWKKWGFWGICAASAATFIINLVAGGNLVYAIIGLTSAVILFGFLNVGGDNKGWPQLE